MSVWHIASVRPGAEFGRWLDTVMMQRALGEGATTLPRTA